MINQANSSSCQHIENAYKASLGIKKEDSPLTEVFENANRKLEENSLLSWVKDLALGELEGFSSEENDRIAEEVKKVLSRYIDTDFLFSLFISTHL